jgi:hypothetical protein
MRSVLIVLGYLYRFRPRILIDVTQVDLTTTVLGFKISMPIMVAPTAMQKMAHPEGMSIVQIYVCAFYMCIIHSNFNMVCELHTGLLIYTISRLMYMMSKSYVKMMYA